MELIYITLGFLDGVDRQSTLAEDLAVFSHHNALASEVKGKKVSVEANCSLCRHERCGTTVQIRNLPRTLFADTCDIQDLLGPYGKVISLKFLASVLDVKQSIRAGVVQNLELLSHRSPDPKRVDLEVVYEDRNAALDASQELDGQIFLIGNLRYQLMCILVDCSRSTLRMNLQNPLKSQCVNGCPDRTISGVMDDNKRVNSGGSAFPFRL